MIQWIAKGLSFSTSCRVPAVLLAIFLNLAIAPCAMALEVIEEGHDCCPPELAVESSQCCELDDANVDKRDGRLELRDSPDYDDVATVSLRNLEFKPSVRGLAAVDPPSPSCHVETRHKIFCVYLK